MDDFESDDARREQAEQGAVQLTLDYVVKRLRKLEMMQHLSKLEMDYIVGQLERITVDEILNPEILEGES